ncbi:hypothetical protein MTR67_035274 [Solanum verrucosum]|uniref:Uncharacterized protein n=1 Tax=Solanum verrucosum TaxID=315347 RepID=A0AAF0U9X2_SOLVR|nr:hypothetical protein MTR67_035274 [Solanum verrucosum]
MIALDLMYKVQIRVVFERTCFSELERKDISLEDIRDAVQPLYKSCKEILEIDLNVVDEDNLGLWFFRDIESMGYIYLYSN